MQDLFKKAVPELSIEHSPYSLHDLSLSGLAAYASRTTNDVCEPGMQVAVQLGLRGIPLFEGTGEVARIEPTTFGTKVAIKLLDCLNVSQLISKYQEILIRTDLACQRRSNSRPAWRSKSRPVARGGADMQRGPIGPLCMS